MTAWMRAALIAFVAMLVAEPASAQWFNFGDDDSYRPRRSARPPQRAPQRARNQPQNFGWWNDDDDDDNVRPQRRGGPSAQSLVNRGPAIREGGPRPSISPSAPPVVSFSSSYGAGSIIIDTSGRALYYVISSSRAYRYRIAVGREGFSWTGTEKVSRKAAWPDWIPPAEMRERQPNLPERMTGGLNNPLGAMALYLGNTLYRIHGTNDASSIGSASSSGCFRMTNSNVIHLATMAGVGTTVHVVHGLPSSVRRNLASAN